MAIENRFTVVLEEQEEGGFIAKCVEIPSAVSQAETREEAIKNVKEAIELMLEVMREDAENMAKALKTQTVTVDVVV